MKIINFLFPDINESSKTSVLLLVARLVFGLFMAYHGLQKLLAFDSMSAAFPDPFGVGGEASLALAVFGELVCGVALALGLLTRLALIPLIITMIVAIVTAHGGSIAEGELAFLYLVVFVLTWFSGAGRYSADALIGQKIKRK